MTDSDLLMVENLVEGLNRSDILYIEGVHIYANK